MTRVRLACAFYLLSMATAAAAQTVTVNLPASASPAAPNVAAPVTPHQLSLAEIRDLSQDVRATLRDQVLRGALDPAITGRNSAPVQAVSIEVGKDGETVGKAKLSWRFDDYGSAVDMILRGPINQSSGVPLTDRGLASGASATLGYTLTLWGSSVTSAAISATHALVSSPKALSPLEALVATGLAIQGAAPSPANQVYSDGTLRALNLPATYSAFKSRDPQAIAYALHQTGAARLNRTLALRGSYGIGSTTFKFAELADPLAETSETKKDSSEGLSVAYVQSLSDGAAEAPLILISGGFVRTNMWKGGRSRQICSPLGVTSASECRAMVIGAPTEQKVDSYEVDIRSWAYGQKLGLNPHFSYDKTTKKWTSEIGLSYLVLKDDPTKEALPQLDTKALTVGLRVGSRPAEDGGIYASIFFGTVLSK